MMAKQQVKHVGLKAILWVAVGSAIYFELRYNLKVIKRLTMAKASMCATFPAMGAGTASWYQSNRWIWLGRSRLGTGFASSHESELLMMT